MSELLVFQGVEARLGERHVLRGVDLELRAGEVLGLIGCNGAGKTTLLRVATGVLAPDAGSVQVAGRPLGSWSRRALARAVAVVPQDTTVPFAFRVLEVVLMGRSPHLGLLGFETARDLEFARRALARVGLADAAQRPLPSLSGGERQLVLVARALAQDSDVLLFDEPTAFLDLRHRADVLRLAREHVADGRRGALVVSHDLSLAARGCDRLALLAEGRVLAVGPPSEVLTPERLRAGFDIEAQVWSAPDGAPVIVPGALRRGPPRGA